MSEFALRQTGGYIAYCGTPPVPEEIWQRWVLDPVLLALLAAVLIGVLRMARNRWGNQQRLLFMTGWGVLSLALVSPLCALSVALFSMRATQHMVLLMVAAPLLALSRPQRLFGRRMQAAIRRLERNAVFASLSALAFAAALWIWHVPRVYDATFRSDLWYWGMHSTLMVTAVLMWMQLLREDSRQPLMRALLAFATFVQMGVLGALLTFSPAALYAAHLTSTLPWGIVPLSDQQLGGLVMWVPGCTVLLLAALWIIRRGLSTGRGGLARRARAQA